MKKYFIILSLCILVILGYGLYIRNTTFIKETDLNNYDSYSDYSVSYIFGNGGENENYISCLTNDLNSMDVIAKVKSTGNNKIMNHSICQNAVVEEVYTGSEYIKKGDNIDVFSNFVGFDKESKLIAGTFVNFMKEDYEYLVFVNSVYKKTGFYENVFTLNENSPFYFCYNDVKNYYPDDNMIAIPYSKVSENEFFVKDKESLNTILQWKKKMLDSFS